VRKYAEAQARAVNGLTFLHVRADTARVHDAMLIATTRCGADSMRRKAVINSHE